MAARPATHDARKTTPGRPPPPRGRPLPDLALPYAAPAARAAGRAMDEATRYVRDRAAAVTGTVGGTVRGSVSVLVEAMR
ncbi:hypothetical protein MET9862_01591 [Methylobacterium symbioticum]|uniref:Uncharacterized protein n=1 Tax=Methylobacterium symbioticum TaxID=2584084 RepID=A0A509E9Y0_9HYPH|nr:hypothetical protein MET9862_01591 [Methylobacterium symbioticum]